MRMHPVVDVAVFVPIVGRYSLKTLLVLVLKEIYGVV